MRIALRISHRKGGGLIMTELNGILNGDVYTISQVDAPCKYGAKSFPGAQVIADYALENANIKTFALEGTDLTFTPNLATPTIGTRVTAGNKVINGIDPKVRESNGSGGGGGSRTKLSAHVEGEYLVISDGTLSAQISASEIVMPAIASNSLAMKTVEVSRKVREGNFDLVKTMVGKPRLTAKVGSVSVDAGECEAITTEARANAIAMLAGEIQKTGKVELFAKLGDAKFELVGGEVGAIEAWASAYVPVTSK